MTVSDRTRIHELEREIDDLRTRLSEVPSEDPLLKALLRDISERKKIEEGGRGSPSCKNDFQRSLGCAVTRA